MAYRARFHGDVVIDLVGYRRFGHNEADEPAYTQPGMYERVRSHPTVRQQWARRLQAEGVIGEGDADGIWDATYQRLLTAQEEVRAQERPQPELRPEPETLEPPLATETEVAQQRLHEIDGALHAWPERFHPNPKLERQLERRARVLASGGGVDWAHAESLAFGSLLQEGVPIRLTGQDTERGTFSQRHIVLHDAADTAYIPLLGVPQRRAPLEVLNSPLSELACLGFEYGYSTAAPHALVLWEAQFGDFVNGAQIVLDQFISAGRAKWGQESRLVLLLPHGYEGQGPEHSSARIERFLQLCAEDNLRVADVTTPAQYFHLLRRQAKLEERRPLVVATPKSLLRHPRAVSSLGELSGGGFRFVIPDDDAAARADEVRRVVLCSGKLYYDLSGAEEREAASHVAIVRVEQLYPFPDAAITAAIEAFPRIESVAWAQEEPANMGAWRFVEPRLRRLLRLADAHDPVYIGRPERASPAEGYANAHERQQQRIVHEALAPIAGRDRRDARRKAAS